MIRKILSLGAATMIVGCGTAHKPEDVGDPSALRVDNWRERMTQAYGAQLSRPAPPTPASREITQGNGFRNAKASLQRILARLIARNQLPASTATIDVYACGTLGPHIVIATRQIRICRESLKDFDTEDALAFVIAHELAHIVLHHRDEAEERAFTEAQDKSGSTARGLMALGTLVAFTVTGGWAAVGMSFIAPLTLGTMERASIVNYGAMFNRRQELEADQLAVKFVAAAGYNPSVAVPFMEQITAEADAKSRSTTEAVARSTPHQMSPESEWVLRTTTSAVAAGGNLRTHPNAELRLTMLRRAVSEQDSSANTVTPTSISFAQELAERDQAGLAGGWRDDPNFAIGYALDALRSLPQNAPPATWAAGYRNAIAASELVPAARRSEPLLRNRTIFYAFSSDEGGTQSAAVEWLNAGGQDYHGAVEVLILAGQDRLASQLVSAQCNAYNQKFQNNPRRAPCRTLQEYKTSMSGVFAARASTQISRHLAAPI